MYDYEKLGVFYLGRTFDLKGDKPTDQDLLYDSKDLVTHAVCVGMTGSGKTGLCITLLEEAAIDGIPGLLIDPKGDLSNLLLTFPQLRPEDFRPWINEEDARRQGLTPDEFARQQADLWKKGLAQWDQPPERIARLREAADFAVYTPGSDAGLPLSILRSFAAPPPALRGDAEALRDRIKSAASGLLALLGLNVDPLQSREHILLSNILQAHWKDGKDLDLPKLIQAIQNPPFSRVGVFELESFFPAKERFGLAMQLNNLLASPGFETWLEGQPLDIGSLLWTAEGKPRLAIVSIAHLGETERMFLVTLLLNEVVAWMRCQSGTTSLRAILYMDEIFGYFPPVANPPSKEPLLTLLKQARAYGLGVVLATQNPVDLDYKGLTNTGTWFLGRLQTQRDKNRLLDGLEGAATGAFDREEMDRILSGLGKRVFYLHNVHEQEPAIFQTRWALSYLRGPLTREQLRRLDTGKQEQEPATAAAPAATETRKAPAASTATGARPVLPPEIPQLYFPIRSEPPTGATLTYRPCVFGLGQVHYRDTKLEVDETRPIKLLADLEGDAVAWEDAEETVLAEDDLDSVPAEGAFAELPGSAARPKSYDTWRKALADHVYRARKLELAECKALGLAARPDESEREFRARVQQTVREERDLEVEKLRQKYAAKSATLENRIRTAQQKVEKEKAQSKQSKFQTVLSFGSTLLGALLGRKKLSVTNVNRTATSMRSAGRSMKESQDVQYAEENLDALQKQLDELNGQLQEETAALQARLEEQAADITQRTVAAKKTDIRVDKVALAWRPWWRLSSGQERPAWR